MARRIWALADLHLSFAQPKPMDVFGAHWHNHAERIAENCRKVIEPEDLLLLPGDLSWALKRSDAAPDLAFIAALPGTKILCKGNHDYWWGSDQRLNYPGLYDTPFSTPDGAVGVAGTRGWTSSTMLMSEQERAANEKIIVREVRRLEKKLTAIADCPLQYVMTHYPPLPEFEDLLKRYDIAAVLYGHLHLNGSEAPLPEDWKGIPCFCVAADRVYFRPRLIANVL